MSIMAPSVDGPIQTQHAVAVPVGLLGIERSHSGGIFPQMVGHRSDQTDTERVLGVDLKPSDNGQVVKKKVLAQLDLFMDQTAFAFGDAVLQNILRKFRNDTTALLSRGLQRSLSTPCLSVSPDAQVDGDLEVIAGLRRCSETKKILKELLEAIECGVEPTPVSGGLGGAYYFRNTNGENIAIVKPTDEEPFAPNNPKGFAGKMLGQPGLKRAVRVGETGFREVAAYLLDHDHFAKVPPTVLVKVAHQSFHYNNASNHGRESGRSGSTIAKIASCQQFVQHDSDASDLGSSRFSVSAVHRIGILDIRIYNTDRHAGNILVRNSRAFDRPGVWGHSISQLNEALELIPIDHGLCLPEALEDPYFEWLHWPQASLPFSEEELDYIGKLDETKDVEILRAELPMLREACYRMLSLCTIFLKRAAAAGLCLSEIGEMMSRDGMEESSQLELLCLQAKLQVERELSAADLNEDDIISEYSPADEDYGEQFEFDMDEEDEDKLHAAAEVKELKTGRNEFFSFPSTGLMHAGGFRSKSSAKETVCGGFRGTELQLHSFATASKFRNSGRNIWPSPLVHQSTSSRSPRFDNIPLQVLYESAPLEENGTMWALQAASPIRSLSGGCALSRMSIKRNFNLSSPVHNRTECCPIGMQDFTPLAEEEELVLSPETGLGASRASWTLDELSSMAAPLRSSSFIEGWQCERRPFSTVSASETTGKANVSGALNPLSLGDVREEDWSLFVDCFIEVLHDSLETRCKQNVSYKQRLGISCKF